MFHLIFAVHCLKSRKRVKLLFQTAEEVTLHDDCSILPGSIPEYTLVSMISPAFSPQAAVRSWMRHRIGIWTASCIDTMYLCTAIIYLYTSQMND